MIGPQLLLDYFSFTTGALVMGACAFRWQVYGRQECLPHFEGRHEFLPYAP
jgi:hypothetical protein